MWFIRSLSQWANPTRLVLILAGFGPATCLIGADHRATPRESAAIFIGNVIPQVAVGGAWSTELQVMHSRFDDVPPAYTVRFLDEAGNDLALPVAGKGIVTSVSGTLQPRGAAFFELSGGPNTLVGVAVAESAASGEVVMNAVLTQRVSGRPDFQATLPSTDRFGTNFQFPFRNDGPFTTTVAFLSTANQAVTAIARDVDGNELCRTAWQMAAGQHQAFLVSDFDRLPCTAEARGVLEFVPSQSGAMIGFLFNDSGAFTTQLPFEISSDP